MWRVVLNLAAGLLWAAEPEPTVVTIAEAVRMATERYPDVGKAKANADQLKGRIREVRSEALPSVNFNSNFLRWRDPSLLNASGIEKFPPELRDALVPVGVNLFDYYLNVKQTLYTAGKIGTALRLASVEAEGATVEIDRAEQDLAMNVVRAFYGLIRAERYLELMKEAQQQRQRHAEMARTRFRNGVATEVDVLRSEVAVANIGPEVVRAENDIRQARALLNFYIVRPIEAPTEAAGQFTDKEWTDGDLETLTLEAMRRRPEIVSLRIAERSAGMQVQLAQAQSRMRLDFEGNYGIITRMPQNLANAEFVRWSIGFNYTFPIFDGFKRSGLVWQATAAQRAARLEREKAEQQVRLSLQQGLDDLRAARETIAAVRANVQQADRVLEMTQANYKYGAATSLDIVDAQAARTVARINLLRGMHDYTIARANLRWLVGWTPWE
ncbi:MAG TPA: TolC family protein [Bryobacteraceae bacterium]|nr:TolC family protein [Bryobacteraceae bacterium]